MLKDKINDYNKKSICEKLKISRSTLNNWEKYKTDNIFKYLTLCEMLEINPLEELEKYRELQQKNSTDKKSML